MHQFQHMILIQQSNINYGKEGVEISSILSILTPLLTCTRRAHHTLPSMPMIRTSHSYSTKQSGSPQKEFLKRYRYDKFPSPLQHCSMFLAPQLLPGKYYRASLYDVPVRLSKSSISCFFAMPDAKPRNFPSDPTTR